MSFDTKGYGQNDPELVRWAMGNFGPQDAALLEILERSRAAGLPQIAVAPFDGLHLEVLTRALAPRRAIEIGALGGYSGVCILRGLPPEGRLDTFELSEEHAKVARESYAKNGFAARSTVHVGPALENLQAIAKEGPFDLVFIDADKTGYPAYLDWAARNLRAGGVVLADNAFAWGGVADAKTRDAGAKALRAFNDQLANDGKFRATMLPTAEGLAMGVRL